MQNLTRANRELFRRSPDECFESLSALMQHAAQQKPKSADSWQLPQSLIPRPDDGRLQLKIGTGAAFLLNDWSFSQLCGLAGVSKDTVSRLSPDTAATSLPRDAFHWIAGGSRFLFPVHGLSRIFRAKFLYAWRNFWTTIGSISRHTWPSAWIWSELTSRIPGV